ncbi:hypothetical protein HMN09_00683800 [Mycena chlorophos]|uniref:Uncharacterized protein n=1 Tax=Mycena chlorophos TaxID=658473 RepID=A0A8H6SYK1_MYCCL|nr:hypothetical protein HMN09_00683800 [Mycena chlorophos]
MPSFTRFLPAALLVAGVAAQNFTINTPAQSQAQQCEPLQISWVAGTPPYFIILQSVQNDPITSTPFLNFGQQTGTSVTWPAVNATIGQQFILQAKDNTGVTVSSAAFTVVSGVGTSCLTGGGSSGGGSGGSSGGSGNSASGNTSPTSAGSGSSAKTSTTGAAASKSSTPSGAEKHTVGLVGLFASVLVMLAFQQ